MNLNQTYVLLFYLIFVIVQTQGWRAEKLSIASCVYVAILISKGFFETLTLKHYVLVGIKLHLQFVRPNITDQSSTFFSFWSVFCLDPASMLGFEIPDPS